MQYLVFLLIGLASAEPRTVNGLYTNAYGNPGGQALLFLHGGPGYNSYSFEVAAAGELSKRGYFVVTFDQRGSGRSALAPLDWFNFANAAEDVDAVVSAYHLRDFIVLGHSYGGTLALKYATLKPKAPIKSIFLLDAPVDQIGVLGAILDNCEAHFVKQNKPDLIELIHELRAELFGREEGVHMNFLFGGLIFQYASMCGLYGPAASNPERDTIVKQLGGKNLPSPTTAFRGFIQNTGWLTGSVYPEIANVLKKVFFAAGTDDGLFKPMNLELIKNSLLPGRFRMISGAGHNPFVDQRAEFLKAVDWANSSP